MSLTSPVLYLYRVLSQLTVLQGMGKHRHASFHDLTQTNYPIYKQHYAVLSQKPVLQHFNTRS